MTDARVRSVESILPKSGKLMVNIDQLQALRLKQLPFGSSKVVIAFSADGNVQLGVTDQEIKTTSIRDITRVPAARSLARQVLGNRNKKDLEEVLATTVASVIGPIPPEGVQPTSNAVQEIRRVRMELARVIENVAFLRRVQPTDKLGQDCKLFLIDQSQKIVATLKKHLSVQLTYGTAKKEDLSLARLLMDVGVSRSIYNKLVTPNLTTDIQTKLDHLVFGSKISKGLRLTYEELNSPVMKDPFLGPALLLRNKFTLLAATSWQARDQMIDGLDEVNLRRLARVQLLMVGPGNYSHEWAHPQPAAPAGYGVVGSILLTINQREVDFHSGVIPVGTLVSTFWSGKVVADNQYAANTRPIDVLAMVSEVGKNVAPKESGYTVFPRDTDLLSQTVYIQKMDMVPFVKANVAEEEQIPDWVAYRPLPEFKVNFEAPVNEPDIFMKSEVGKAWTSAFISKIFLKTSADAPKAKRSAGGVGGSLPSDLFEEIKNLKSIKPKMRENLVSFLMQFQSRQMMKHAYDVFSGELQRMEMDGSWVNPDEREDSDESDED